MLNSYCANTTLCLVVTRAAGETAMVPAEPGSPEQRGGREVSRLLLWQNSCHESGPEAARQVLRALMQAKVHAHTRTHTHTDTHACVCTQLNADSWFVPGTWRKLPGKLRLFASSCWRALGCRFRPSAEMDKNARTKFLWTLRKTHSRCRGRHRSLHLCLTFVFADKRFRKVK